MRRTPDPADGRFTLAILTDLGHQKVEEATPGHVQTVRELILDRLTKPQTRQLRGITTRITHAIRSEGSWVPPANPRADWTAGT